MVKIVEVKSEKKSEKPVEKKLEEIKKEKVLDKGLDESEESLLAIADSQDSGWDEVLDSNASPTLDRRIVRSTPGFSLVGNLENSLEDVPVENIDENKPIENYKNDSSSYMGKGGVLGQTTETRRVEEFLHDGPVKTINNWRPEFEDTSVAKMYDIKRKAEDTLGDVNGAAFQKYTPRR